MNPKKQAPLKNFQRTEKKILTVIDNAKQMEIWRSELIDIFYNLCSSDDNADILKKLMANPVIASAAETSDIVSHALISAASKSQIHMLNFLLDIPFAQKLDTQHISPAFNCASQQKNAQIMMSLIDEKTHLISRSFTSTEPYDQEVQDFINRMSGNPSFSFHFSNHGIFRNAISMGNLSGPSEAKINMDRFEGGILTYQCLQENDTMIRWLLDKNSLESGLRQDILDHAFISCFKGPDDTLSPSSNAFKPQSLSALIYHPKSRAAINSSDNIKRYFEVSHFNIGKINFKAEIKSLIDTVNLKAQLDCQIATPKKPSSILKI